MYAGKMATKQTWWPSDDGHRKTGTEITSETPLILHIPYTLCTAEHNTRICVKVTVFLEPETYKHCRRGNNVSEEPTASLTILKMNAAISFDSLLRFC
jgi:hypothetical protein